MRRLTMVASGVAAAALVLTGCAGGNNAAAPSGEALADLKVTTPAPSGPADGVVWNIPYGEPDTIDPARAFNYSENTVVANLCESLLRLEPDNSIVPALAESYEVVDASTYVYDIRPDVTFWDGTPMTMEDVLYSLNRHRDPAEGSFWTGSVTNNIASIEQTGDWQVTITLTAPDSTFNSYMVTPIGSVVQQAQRVAAGDSYGTPAGGIMCTGPMSVGEWASGSHITLERYDGYWDAENKAVSPSIELRFLADAAAISAALQSGEIDGSYDVPLSAIGQLETSTTGSMIYGVSTQLIAVVSTGEGPLGDPAVRRALISGLDRNVIASTIFEGTATPAISLIPDGGWSYSPEINEEGRAELPGAEVDMDAARSALEEADVDTSEPITIAYPAERTYYADMLSEMANVASELGLTLRAEPVPGETYGTFFTDESVRGAYGGFVTTNYMDVPDPLTYLSAIAGKDGGQNYNGMDVPEIEELFAQARAESDEDARTEITNEIQAAVMHEMPWLPIVNPAVRMYMSNEITGAPASFSYLYYPWAADIGAV